MCNTFTIRVPISLVPALLNDKENAAHLEIDKKLFGHHDTEMKFTQVREAISFKKIVAQIISNSYRLKKTPFTKIYNYH